MCLSLSFLVLRAMLRYDTTPISHLINWRATLHFYQHNMHDTTYDTPIEARLGYQFWSFLNNLKDQLSYD
jgi:hypothetical protein